MTIFTQSHPPKLRPLTRTGYLLFPLSLLLFLIAIFSRPTEVGVSTENVFSMPQLSDSGVSAAYQDEILPAGIHSFSKQYLKKKLSGRDPALEAFITAVANGESADIRGVYLRDNFALPIIQQPDDRPAYVSNHYGLVTQFKSAARYGVTGLLAHNYLAGKEFFKLQIGQEVAIIYGDHVLRRYQITEIDQLQKLSPDRQTSDYIELSTGRKLSTSDVFRRYYRGEHHVTFQTCLEKDGNYNWGLLFVRAIPVNE